MTADEIAELFGRRTEAFARQDAAALAADFTEDGVLYSPTAGTIIGRRGIERVYRLWFKAFPDLKWEVNDLVIGGDRVASLNTVSGTDLGGFLGLPPTGRFIRIGGAFMYTFRGALIATERRVLDFSGVLLQLAGEVGPVTDSFRQYRETLARARSEQELRIAAEIQRALLPRTQYRNAHVEVAATSLPCRAIGGDFFDYSESSDGTFGCVLGDVAGKGPPAALLTAVLQGIFAANADSGFTPAETMGRVNTALLRRAIESRFATLWYAMLSCDGNLTYCNAGHNPPLLFGRDGLRGRLEAGGPIVGAFPSAEFEQEKLQLNPDDTLVVFSDGVPEATNREGEEFGEHRLVSCVEANREMPPARLLECVLDTVQGFRADAVQSDDLTIFILRYSAGP